MTSGRDLQRDGMNERLQDYLDDRLSDAERREVQRLIETDAQWRDELEMLQRMGAAFRAAMPDESETAAPSDFVEHVRQRIDAQRQAAATRSRWGRILAITYAAAALLVAGISAHWMFSDRDDASSVEQTARHDPQKDPYTERVDSDKARADKKAGVSDLLGVAGQPRVAQPSNDVAQPSNDVAQPSNEVGNVRGLGNLKKAEENAAGLGKGVLDEMKEGRTARDQRAGVGGGGASGAGGRKKARTRGAETFGQREEAKRKPPRGGPAPAKAQPYGPGGGVRPGLRAPSDGAKADPAKAPRPTSPAPPSSPPAKDRKAGAEPAYAFSIQARSVAEGQAALDRLLATWAGPKKKSLGAERKSDPRSQLAALNLVLERRPAPPTARAERDAGDEDAEEGDAEEGDAEEGDAESGDKAPVRDAERPDADTPTGPKTEDDASAPRARAPTPPPGTAPAEVPKPETFDIEVTPAVLRRLLEQAGPGRRAGFASELEARGRQSTRVSVRIIVRQVALR